MIPHKGEEHCIYDDDVDVGDDYDYDDSDGGDDCDDYDYDDSDSDGGDDCV